MAETLTSAPPRPPLWRNVRFRRVLGQLIFVALVVVVARELVLNLQYNAAQRHEELGFDFLDVQAGFPITGGRTDYSANDSIGKAFQLGLVNTLFAAGLGIVLASILGLILGIARLSPNWLVRKIAQVYVEVIRNTPAAVQVVFWWIGVFLTIATIDKAISIFGVAFLSNRGAFLPWFHLQEGAGTWGFFLLAGLIAAIVVRRWRTSIHDRTGRPHHRFLWAAGTLLLLGVIGMFVSGTPITGDVPEFAERTYEGGVVFLPEFLALLVGLVVYTASFIAEIIRGSIQSVQKGQREAAEALGLSRGQQMRLVILPQALRVALPAINSQYLNLTKNTTIGAAVGYTELAHVSTSIITQRGYDTGVNFLLMLTFLGISLSISLVMNLANRSVVRKGAR